MSPAAEMPQVLLVRVWLAEADQAAGGPVTAAAVTVTFCDALNPCTAVAPVAVPLKYSPELSAAKLSSYVARLRRSDFIAVR